MPTQRLTVGTTEAASSDVVVASGDELTVFINDAEGPRVKSGARVDVQLKDAAGQYFNQIQLSPADPSFVIGAGTWRFFRPAGGPACGVCSG